MLYSQEVCDNSIDDDGDNLVDINDPDCDCSTSSSTFYLIESFENNTCCPTLSTSECCLDPLDPGYDCCTGNAIGCLDSQWELVHEGTPDYMNCTYDGSPLFPPPPVPFPFGTGCIGVANGGFYCEAIGTCLPSPLINGDNYILEFFIGFPDVTNFPGLNNEPIEISLWGQANCPNLPSAGLECLEDFGWEEIINIPVNGAQGSWVQILENFSPSSNYSAIAIAASCATVNSYSDSYHYIDEIVIISDDPNGPIFVEQPVLSGNCVSGFELEINDDPGNSYQWYLEGVAITGATSANLNLATPYTSGNYQVRVTTANGCGTSNPFFFDPDLATLTFNENIENESCPSENDGQIEITTDFENQPVTYNWNNNGNGNILDDLEPGNYSVTITDNNGCFGIENYTIEEGIDFTSIIDQIIQPKEDMPFGSATATPLEGEGPFQFFWSNGESTQEASNLPPGLNYVTITDGNGCEIIDSVLILEILLALDTTSQTICSYLCNGSIELFVEGGLAPYSYLWNTNETTPTIEELCPGEYQVTIIDDFGTDLVLDFTIIAPDPIELNLSHSEYLCDNNVTTNIELEIQGGSPGFSFIWNNGSTSQNLSNVGPGNYEVTVTDINNCESFASTIIDLRPPLEYEVFVKQPSCDNLVLGSIDLIFDNASEPMNILWSNGATTNSIQDLPPNIYTVEIMDTYN
ncbi:MAG: immunoglobulin domain-containing protein, partial [Bacteroidota bacterium]